MRRILSAMAVAALMAVMVASSAAAHNQSVNALQATSLGSLPSNLC